MKEDSSVLRQSISIISTDLSPDKRVKFFNRILTHHDKMYLVIILSYSTKFKDVRKKSRIFGLPIPNEEMDHDEYEKSRKQYYKAILDKLHFPVKNKDSIINSKR